MPVVSGESISYMNGFEAKVAMTYSYRLSDREMYGMLLSEPLMGRSSEERTNHGGSCQTSTVIIGVLILKTLLSQLIDSFY